MTIREVWPDLARGVAVISMIFAHTSPVGGVLGIVEFLTAPLFAMLVTLSLVLSWEQRRVEVSRWLAIQWLRGVLLFILGELIQTVYSQILSVLQTLGVLTVVAAALMPLLARRPRLSLLLGLVGAFVGPMMMAYARSLSPGSLWAWRALDLLAAGRFYRLTSFLAIGLIGIALLHLIRRLRRVVHAATILTVLGVALLAFGRLGPLGLKPYTGTTLEIVFVQVICAATVLWCVVLADFASRHPESAARTVLAPLIATGSLALTAYALQFVVLRFLTGTFLNGGRDDHWWVLATTCAVLLVFCTLWRKTLLPGPLEAVIRVPARLLGPSTKAPATPVQV